MFWLRAHELQWQTAWGSEWGGESLRQIERLNQQFFQPLGAQLVRFPLGRKGYNGRVERSHRTDDEEFSLPLLMSIRDERELVRRAAQWVYYYNVERPHSGVGMDGVSPWRKLRELGLQAPVEFALLPPVVCDRIAAHWLLGPGNDLLTYYKWFYKRPAMAVGLTDHRSPVGELTTFHMPLPSWSPPKRRGCPPRLTQLLVARWCT